MAAAGEARDGALQDRVAIVTGGASGIGQAICRAFAREGAKVAVLDLDAEGAGATAQEIGGRAFALDVSDSAACKAAVDAAAATLGPPRALVCCAAVFPARQPLADLDEAVWDRALQVNIGGHFTMCKHVIPHMRAAGGGAIVHVSSQMAVVANRGQAAYCATKGALTMLSRGIALDYAEDGIRSNTLRPGGIATEGMAEVFGGDMARAEREWGAKMHPLGRLGRVEEVAEAAVYLASDRSSFVTGADLTVDGGYSIW